MRYSNENNENKACHALHCRPYPPTTSCTIIKINNLHKLLTAKEMSSACTHFLILLITDLFTFGP